MADNLITTNITANADFSSLRAQLAATTAQLLKLQEVTAGTNAKLANQIGVMNKAFATTLTSTGQFSQHFVSLTSDVEKFGRNLDRGRLKLNDYFQTWQGHTRKTSNLVRDLAKQQVMMEQAIIQPVGKNAQGLMQYNVMVAKGIDEVKNRTAIARQELAIMNKVMLDGSNQLINWGKNTQWAGRQLTVGLTVPLAAFGMAAQKAFREADAELVRLTKVYGGLSAVSASELAKVRKDVSDTAREIAGSYGIAYKDTIALAADLAATGQQGQALLEATKETSRLAVLGEVDRQDAMKATLAIQNAFKSSTDELTQSIDFLNAVENQTSTSLADLVEAIPKAGPVVKSLGGDVKDLALYLTAMKEGGVNASEGANAIKSAMASLINPTKVAKEMFTGFGINIDQIVTSNAGNLTATIVDLQSALDNLDPLSKSRAIEQLFGKFQYARMSALFENLGKSGSQTLQVMDLMKASATDLANISSRELGMMTESASGKFKRALASVQADLASVGNQFLTISTKVLEVVDGIIKFFQNLPAPVKTFLNLLGGITAIAGPLIMLAGVMGNFVGYIIKGIFHLRQLAKGGQGFKLLTPEIMAADAAAKGLAATFYSDTEATLILTNAVNTLAASFDTLEVKANAAKVAVQPGISTVAGSVLAMGNPGQRVVDKNHPLVGRPYSRDMSHLIPSGDEQMGTIFGTVPGSKPVNIKVGRNPQAYMAGDLPKIPGLTSIGGVSTGIVASEAAKWHAMTAAIAMQSEAELKVLKAEVMATGTVTSSLSDSYQALLPEFTEITSLASQETAAIVAQVQQGKITVEAARAKIIQLNATVEAMLAETARLTAAGMGRTANLTIVPLTSQPVVDPVTGKSNMKEMFHKGPTKEMVDRIARALAGVRTSGAGYNIETTKPRFAKGGIVPGTGNTDTYHTTAEPGAFVINKKSTEQNMPIISKILGGTPTFRNAGGAVPVVLTPGEAVIPAKIAQSDPNLMLQLNGGPGNTSGMGRVFGGSILSSMIKKLSRGHIPDGRTKVFARAFFDTKTGGNVTKQREWLNDSMTMFGRLYKNPQTGGFYKPSDLAKMTDKEIRSMWKGIEKGHFSAKRSIEGTDDYFVPGAMGPQSSSANKKAISGGNAAAFADDLESVPIHPMVIMRSAAENLGYSGNPDQFMKAYRSLITALRGRGKSRTKPNFGPDDTFEMFAERILRRHLNKVGGGNNSNFFDELLSYGTVRGRQAGRSTTASGELKDGIGSLYTARIESLNAGGPVPGAPAQRLFGGGLTRRLFLGMPRSAKAVEAQRAAKIAMEKASEAAKNSRFAKEEPINYGELLSPTSGRSFPVSGIGGVYSRNGERVFVKPMLDEKAALAEMRATEIARDVHGLHAPKQRVVVMKDPTDPTGKRNLLALESKYDKTLAEQDGKFTVDQYFRQLVASALRGDKDLGRGNLSGNILADVGPAGVFGTASGLRDYSATMPSFKHQAMINLMGVKGSGAKKFFAESTADIPKGMTADQYHSRMLQEIEAALPKLKQTVSRFDLNAEEKVVYEAMIRRLSDARKETYGDLHGIHSSIKLSPEKTMTPAAIAKMIAADELKRRQMGHSVSLSDNAFKTPENGFKLGGFLGAITKGKAMHRIGAGFGKDSTGGWGVTSLEIGMAEKLFASTGLTKRTQRILYDKLAANLAKEMPYGYTKNAQGHLIKALEPDVMDTVIKSAASDTLSAAEGRKVLSQIDREILRKKFANWDSKKDTPLTEALKKLIFSLEGREKGGPVNSGQPYIVGEKGPEIFVPRNAGGIIPNGAPMAQGYNAGGFIKMMLMQLLGGFGGQKLGAASGIPGGDMIGMMMGSMLAGGGMGLNGGAKVPMTLKGSATTPLGATKLVAPLDGAIGPSQKVLTSYGKKLDSLSASKNILAKAAGFAGKAITKLNIGIGAVSLVVGVGINRYKAYQESMRLNALGYGMTAEAASKAGLKFTNFNDKIKEAIGHAEALRERNRLLYESMNGSGTPLNITIEQYKKLKKEVKDNYSDQVLLINKTGVDDQTALAVRLKEQLIAMGVSAEEASKKIYAMYAASKFAGSAAKYTVSSDDFNNIKDSASAAVSAIKSLNAAMALGKDPTEQANQLNTAMMALSTDVETRTEALIKKRRAEATKNGEYFSVGQEKQAAFDAELAAVTEINNQVKNQVVLTSEVVDELALVDPSIRKIVNEQETGLSLWQKTRIQIKGFTGDLRGLSAAQTNDLYNLQIVLGKAIATANANGALKKQYKLLEDNKRLQAKYERDAKGQKVKDQISDRDKMASLQKQIDLNNKLADARIKALTAAKEESDIGREIAKKQAEYDAALATGDTAGAQQASLDMEGLQGQLQYNSQVKSIEESTARLNAPLIKQLEALQKKQQDLADKAAIAGEKLGDLTKVIETQETAIDAVNSAMLDYEIRLLSMAPAQREEWKKTKTAREMIDAIGDAAKKAGVKLDGIKADDIGKKIADGIQDKLNTITTVDASGNVTIKVGTANFQVGKFGTGTKSDPLNAGTAENAYNTVDKARSWKEDRLQNAAVMAGTAPGGIESINDYSWNNSVGPYSLRQIIKDYAGMMSYTEGTFFKLQNKDGSYTHFKVVDSKGNVIMVDGKAMGGSVKRYEKGSPGGVSGPGTKTSDSIPALLSDGEWVIKADSVEKAKKEFGPSFFDDLNAGRFHKGGEAGHRHGRNLPSTFENSVLSKIPNSTTSTATSGPDPKNINLNNTMSNPGPGFFSKAFDTLMKPFTPSETPKASEQSDWSKAYRNFAKYTDMISKFPEMANPLLGLVMQPLRQSRDNIYAGDAKWNDFTNIGSSLLGTGVYTKIPTTVDAFTAAKTLAKTKSAIKGPTALSPWESELIKAGKLAKEGGFTPIEKLGSVKYSTLVDEAKKLTPTKGSLPTPAGEYSFGFSPASLDSFPPEETFKSGISLIQKNPYSASEWVGPPHVLTVYAPDGAVAGNLSWDSITGTIKMISVEPAHRKLGLARFMNQYAASITRLKHSMNRTPDGRGYSSAIGGIMPDKPFISPGKVSLMSVISEALGIKPKAKVTSSNADVPSYSAPTVGAPQSALDAELLAAQKARMAAESAAQYKRLTAWRNNPNRTYNEYPFVNGSLMESIDEADLLRLMKFGNDTPATWSWSNPLTANLVPRPARPGAGAPAGLITGATGGYLNAGKFNIPKFDSGINNVPADMLAQLHKNEAVVPANMNPFNPNANNATMGGGVYNITNNINGYDGNLEQLSSMVTQKTITAIKSLDSRTASMSGPQMNVSIR